MGKNVKNVCPVNVWVADVRLRLYFVVRYISEGTIVGASFFMLGDC